MSALSTIVGVQGHHGPLSAIGSRHAISPLGPGTPLIKGGLSTLLVRRTPNAPCVPATHTTSGQGVGGVRDVLFLCDQIDTIVVVSCPLAGCQNQVLHQCVTMLAWTTCATTYHVSGR